MPFDVAMFDADGKKRTLAFQYPLPQATELHLTGQGISLLAVVTGKDEGLVYSPDYLSSQPP